jgi:flavorubredoxin
VHLIIAFLSALGHKEHSNNLLHAYREYIEKKERLINRTCPRFEDKTDDIIEDSHRAIEGYYAEYVNAYKELCKAYQYHIDLITIKPWKEPKNA